MWLAGCASTTFDSRACPQEKRYTADEQNALAAAIVTAPKIVQDAAIDYMKLRDKARACRGEAAP